MFTTGNLTQGPIGLLKSLFCRILGEVSSIDEKNMLSFVQNHCSRKIVNTAYYLDGESDRRAYRLRRIYASDELISAVIVLKDACLDEKYRNFLDYLLKTAEIIRDDDDPDTSKHLAGIVVVEMRPSHIVLAPGIVKKYHAITPWSKKAPFQSLF